MLRPKMASWLAWLRGFLLVWGCSRALAGLDTGHRGVGKLLGAAAQHRQDHSCTGQLW